MRNKIILVIPLVLALAAGIALAVDYIVVDDFDSYENTIQLKLVWDDSTMGLSGNGVVVLNNFDANFAVDGNSMLFEYWNDTAPYYSETTRAYSTAQDWSYATTGVTALELDFFGDVNNGLDPPMYVKLSDDTNSATVNHDDFNDVLEEELHTWVIPLADFTNVNLSSITSITLGIGDGKSDAKVTEAGTLYFDDIRLYPPRCFPEYGPAADFTDDCNVDMNDLFIVAREWGRSGGWYQARMPDVNAVVEYLFDEGSGTIVENTGTWGDSNGYDLTIGLDLDGNSEPNNDPCWFNDPCRGWCMFFDGELGLHPDVNANGGDYLVIPPLNLNSNTVTIATWLKPDPWLIDPKKMIYEQKGAITGIVHSRDASTTAGICYGYTGGYTYNGELDYNWGHGPDVWCWCYTGSDIFIPDWQWSMAALVIEPDAGILYLADFKDPNDPNDDVLHTAVNPFTHNAEEFDGRTLIAGDELEIVDDRFFRGYMDDVRIYTYSLTQSEIIGLAGMDEIVYIPLNSEVDFCVGRKEPCDPCSPVNDQIDFCDFSEFADEWLETKLWPQP